MHAIMLCSLIMRGPAECTLCPRRCGARRQAGGLGLCGAGAGVRVALADLHFWEEPPLSGAGGAGAVFFAGCPLGCAYCQNYEISRGNAGREVSAGELADIFLFLEERGASNIDLVTGTPYVPQIVEAVRWARDRGLKVPVVWNTSGYETVETLHLLAGTVDIYLPDFKYWSDEAAERYSGARGYRRQAKLALREMVQQQPQCRTAADGTMRSGVLVRHLLLPGRAGDAVRILRYLSDTYGTDLWVSLMRQYTPVPGAEAFPELQRTVSAAEYERAAAAAASLGFEVLFTQGPESATRDYIPDFAD